MIDLQDLVQALQTKGQAAQDEKDANQATIDADNTQIAGLKSEIKDSQAVQAFDDAVKQITDNAISELNALTPPVQPTPPTPPAPPVES